MHLLLSLIGIWRNEVVSTADIENDMRVLTLLDVVNEVVIFLGHHLAQKTMQT